ncbi:MAG: hypothetical protein ACRAVC_00700 [Trichormus sp.]|uniref:hypothetical protein n=1 Tax=Nostoc sp. FACHB-190 TaxID=2692838 RepID=UPI0016881390|nr:hypothetical protein [Nostoc sp. FACHB-190]MBD2303503.1 hypothetical protein [Nostoc sp. FACHB-190]
MLSLEGALVILATKVFTDFLLKKVYTNIIRLLYLTFSIIVFSLGLWGSYRFIKLNSWEAVPPQIAASIIGGLFAIITLLWGNFLSNQKKREDTEYLRKSEFYEEVINKLYYITVFPEKITSREGLYELMDGLVGKIYTQGSDKLINMFGEIVETVQSNSPEKSLHIQASIKNIIDEIRKELGNYSKPTNFDKIFYSKLYLEDIKKKLPE